MAMSFLASVFERPATAFPPFVANVMDFRFEFFNLFFLTRKTLGAFLNWSNLLSRESSRHSNVFRFVSSFFTPISLHLIFLLDQRLFLALKINVRCLVFCLRTRSSARFFPPFSFFCRKQNHSSTSAKPNYCGDNHRDHPYSSSLLLFLKANISPNIDRLTKYIIYFIKFWIFLL